MIGFGIRYLNGFVAAAAGPEDPRAEWPPHPGRIFMALAAAYFHSGARPAERKALLWLESLSTNGAFAAPLIAASDVTYRAAVTHFVPVNDKLKSTEAFQGVALLRERQPRTFTRAWLDNETAYIWWPEAKPNLQITEALQELCGKVSRIGHSSSLVHIWIARPEEIGVATWIPDEDRATIRLRIAISGTLAYLEQQFNGTAVEQYAKLKVAAEDTSDKKAQRTARRQLRDLFKDTPPRQFHPNLPADYGYAKPLPPSCFPEIRGSILSPHLLIMSLEQKSGWYRYLDLVSVLKVIEHWRAVLCRQSSDIESRAREVLTGRDSDGMPLQGAHLAFVPCAFVGETHADGHLLGMGLALPRDVSGNCRRDVVKALARVTELNLGRLGVWKVDPVMSTSPPVSLRSETWTADATGARTWGTVTPIANDLHPKSRRPEEACSELLDMIALSCERMGLPVPREMAATPVSPHVGVPTAVEFPMLRRQDGTLRRHTHAILQFAEPVRGPIILGAGRYRGYGVLRPVF
jgi:CRISPR-associated protein Csb2